MITAALSQAMLTHQIVLSAPDCFTEWRNYARSLLAEGVPPDRIVWQNDRRAMGDLFALSQGEVPTLAAMTTGTMRVPRDLMEVLRLALLHRAPERFALAYRIVWRLRSEPMLHRDAGDVDMMALHGLARAVRRDMHKMHAFVRFRKVSERDGREQFAAWFEPDHHISRAVAGFFRDRFTGMDWMIVTPEATIRWDGKTLMEGPGGTKADVPSVDAIEAEWRAYYSHIFNPARLKLNAMRREMPVRYWRNLPEADLIAPLVKSAVHRVERMMESPNEPDLFGPAPGEERAERRFNTLAAFYEALQREDEKPSPAFSDRIVTGEGPPDAPIMLIGEQPGDLEDEQGRPFVGPAGQLLNICLEQAGLVRSRIYLTNAVKRFKYGPRGKRRLHQTPSGDDIAHYRWWLAEEIRLVAPRVVVTLGATALQAVTGKKVALGRVRGTDTAWNGTTVLPTLHPSYLLRLPDEQARAIERKKLVRDLARAAALMEGRDMSRG